MGMYTQIYVKATFKENLSDNVVNINKYFKITHCKAVLNVL